MSETDSFIEEVTEEVRRDRLFGLMRRYGWIAVLAVLLIVGGAAYREYSRAAEQAAARALGDALLAALDNEDVDARAAALGQIQAGSGEAAAIVAILQAGILVQEGKGADVLPLLQPIVNNQDIKQDYRDLAHFKQLLHADGALDAAQRREGFQILAEPGKPLRVLAEEQLALLELQAGEQDAAIVRLKALLEDADLTQNLQQRTRQLLIALGQDMTNSN
ncbi:hypothetical protein ACMAY7_09335 [Rhodobacteraceae bacterium nBUS_24]